MSSFGIDLPSIMQAAAQTRRMQIDAQRAQDERAAYERQLDRELQAQKALQAYNAGNRQALAQVDPRLHQQLEQGRYDTQLRQAQIEGERAEQAAAQQKGQDASRLAVARELKYFANAVRNNQANWPGVRQAMQQRMAAGRLPQMELPEQLTPEMQQQVDMLADMDLASLDPQKVQEPPLDPIAKRVINELGLRPGTPEFQQAYKAAREDEERQEMARRKAGATSVNVGTGAAGIETATKAKFEQTINTNDTLLEEIGLIGDDISQELVGFKGRAREGVASTIDFFGAPAESVASALGVDPQAQLEFLDKRQELKSRVKDVGDRVLRIRTGAAAPAEEVKKLEAIVGNLDGMGERQLRAALRTFAKSLELDSRLKRKAIAGGTQVAEPKSGQGGGKAAAQDLSRADARALELEGQGMPPEKVLQQLKSEGLL